MYMSDRPEFRLLLLMNGKQFTPRHSDFFTDLQLKLEIRPDLKLHLVESCEALCNGADPVETAKSHSFPDYFSKPGDETWTLQTTMYQTGGLPTEIFFCGLQCLIRVYDLNDPALGAPEAFRKAFVNLEKAMPVIEAVKHLKPQVLPGKRYFDRVERFA
jgi:hypothetical protein